MVTANLGADSGQSNVAGKTPLESGSPTRSPLRIAPIGDEVYRVYRIDESLRDSCKQARAASGETVKQFMATSNEGQFPLLIADLRALGIEPTTGKLRPARLPLTDGLAAFSIAAKEVQ